LADYFDYIGGTSTGAILATSLSLGLSVAALRNFYLEGGSAMFTRASLVKQFYYRNAETRFVAKLQRELKNEKGEYFLLGSDALRTDREVGDLIVKKDEDVAGSAFAPKRFTYVRYNPIISEDGLRDLGFDTIPANHVQPLDSADHMPELMAVGKIYARRVALSHFGPFAPTAHT